MDSDTEYNPDNYVRESEEKESEDKEEKDDDAEDWDRMRQSARSPLPDVPESKEDDTDSEPEDESDDTCYICFDTITVAVYSDCDCDCSKVVHYCELCFIEYRNRVENVTCVCCRKAINPSYKIDWGYTEFLQSKYGDVPCPNSCGTSVFRESLMKHKVACGHVSPFFCCTQSFQRRESFVRHLIVNHIMGFVRSLSYSRRDSRTNKARVNRWYKTFEEYQIRGNVSRYCIATMMENYCLTCDEMFSNMFSHRLRHIQSESPIHRNYELVYAKLMSKALDEESDYFPTDVEEVEIEEDLDSFYFAYDTIGNFTSRRRVRRPVVIESIPGITPPTARPGPSPRGELGPPGPRVPGYNPAGPRPEAVPGPRVPAYNPAVFGVGPQGPLASTLLHPGQFSFFRNPPPPEEDEIVNILDSTDSDSLPDLISDIEPSEPDEPDEPEGDEDEDDEDEDDEPEGDEDDEDEDDEETVEGRFSMYVAVRHM